MFIRSSGIENRLKWLAFVRLATNTTVTHRTMGSTVTVGIRKKYSPAGNGNGNVKGYASCRGTPAVTFCQGLAAISSDVTFPQTTPLEWHPKIGRLDNPC